MADVTAILATALQHHQSANFAQAEPLYRQVLETDPANVDALHLLGLLLHQTGRTEAAIDCLHRALALKPDFADAHYNLGNVYRDQGRLTEAAASYQTAVRYRPNYPEAFFNLGNVLRDLQQLERAATCYDQALRLRPNYVKALINRGNTLHELGRLDDAADSFRQAIRLKPDSANAYNNLGNLLRDQGKLREAEAACRQAVQREPGFPEAHGNLANVLRDQGRFPDAMSAYAESLRLRPDYARAHLNRAQTLLLLGNWAEGWAEYEWRWKCKEFTDRFASRPRWDGEPLDGKTILLYPEQGLGDTLHFIRYARLVKARGGRVVFESPRPLAPILQSCPGIDQSLTPDPSPNLGEGSGAGVADVYAPLLSLPGIFGTTLTSVPADIPYLFADEALVQHWRNELRSITGFRIGINWQGNPRNPWDRRRSIPLAAFERLATIAGVALISLQKGSGTEQLDECQSRFPIMDLGGRLDESAGPFMDTAAVMRNLDLVITADTVLGHLAGALAVPVWLAMPYPPDWRWLLDRDDTPWYPTMRLFRQREIGKWDDVFARMADELRQAMSPSRS